MVSHLLHHVLNLLLLHTGKKGKGRLGQQVWGRVFKCPWSRVSLRLQSCAAGKMKANSRQRIAERSAWPTRWKEQPPSTHSHHSKDFVVFQLPTLLMSAFTRNASPPSSFTCSERKDSKKEYTLGVG